MKPGTNQAPLVTIVTPCLNTQAFVSRTIESVLTQDYPNVEYILVDGGSTDGTLEILERYAFLYPDRVRLVVERDSGPAEALRKGLQHAQGEYFAYLNADDTYFPGAIRTAVHWLDANKEVAGVYGNAYWIDEKGERIASYPTEPFDRETLKEHCYICQPACFLRTQVLRDAGGFNEDFQVAFDYELWLRLAQTHKLLRVESLLANSRMHKENKTFRQRTIGFEEANKALRHYYGYVPFRWAHSYASFLLDQRDQFFEPLRPSFTKYVFAFLIGSLLNWSNPLPFWKEWRQVMSFGAFVRRWNDTWVARRLGIVIRQTD